MYTFAYSTSVMYVGIKWEHLPDSTCCCGAQAKYVLQQPPQLQQQKPQTDAGPGIPVPISTNERTEFNRMKFWHYNGYIKLYINLTDRKR